jgi:RNA polymerase sigma factor (sigma-70 family)
MDSVTPDLPAGNWPPDQPVAAGRATGATNGPESEEVRFDPRASLGELLVALQSASEAVRKASWESIYDRYHQVVWAYVYFVLRSTSGLREPREDALDVASDVLGMGLQQAARHYREQGKAERWLKTVAVRAALRRKQAHSGRWAAGDPGRSYHSFDEAADQIVEFLDGIEAEERIEFQRRLDALRRSPDPTRRRWAAFLDLYLEGCGYAEIGERMELTEGSARNWMCAIRKHLSRPLGDE